MPQPEANSQPKATQDTAARTREFGLVGAILVAFLLLGVSHFRSGSTPRSSNADLLAKVAARSLSTAAALTDERSAIVRGALLGQDANAIEMAQRASDQEIRALRVVFTTAQSRAAGSVDLQLGANALSTAAKLPEQRKAATSAATEPARQAITTFYDGLIDNLIKQTRALSAGAPPAVAPQIDAAAAVAELVRDGETERGRVVAALAGGDVPAPLAKELEALREKQKHSLEALKGGSLAKAIDQVFQDKPAAELTRLRGLLADNGQQLGFKGAGSLWWDAQGEVLGQLRGVAGDATTQLDIPSDDAPAPSSGNGLALVALLLGAAAAIALVVLPKATTPQDSASSDGTGAESNKGDKQEIKNLKRAAAEAQTREREAAQKAERRIGELESEITKQASVRASEVKAATESLRAEISELKRQVDAAGKDASSGPQARMLAASEESLAATRAELAAATERRTAVEQELATLRERLAASEATVAGQANSESAKLAEIQATVRQLSQEKAELAATLNARDTLISELQARNKELAFGREVLFKQLRDREAAAAAPSGLGASHYASGRDTPPPTARDGEGGSRERIDLGELLKQLEALAPPPEKK